MPRAPGSVMRLVRRARLALLPGKHRNRAHALGEAGERAAAEFLQKSGYRILSRNQRTKQGEIDIIARSPQNAVVYIEVKTRRPGRWTGQSAITPSRKRRLIRAGQALARRHGWQDGPLRIDVMVLEYSDPGAPPSIRHYVNAVTLNDV